MPSLTEWRVPPAYQPHAGDYDFDLDRVLSSIVGLHSIIPPDAFSAETLGTERAGNGVVIDEGLVLTIGYLITEAEAVWLHRGDGHGSRQTCQSPGMTSRHDKVATPQRALCRYRDPRCGRRAACPALRTSRPLNFMDDGLLRKFVRGVPCDLCRPADSSLGAAGDRRRRL